MHSFKSRTECSVTLPLTAGATRKERSFADANDRSFQMVGN